MKHLTRPIVAALWLMIAAGAIIAATPQPAAAQDVDAQLEKMLAQASEDYDMLMIGEARATLDKAISMAENEGATGRAVADLYVMRAIVIFAEERDEAKVEQDFVRALEHDYDVSLPAHYKNPTLAQAMERARQTVPEPSGGSGGAQADGEGFKHEPIATTRARQPLEIEAFVDEQMPVYRVFVYHRRYRETDYQRIEMKATSATRFAVELSADQVRTSQIEYYIEAVDRGGEMLAEVGSKSSPLAITVLGSSSDGDSDDDRRVQDDTDDDDDLFNDSSASGQKFYVMLAGGSGLGFLPSGTPTAHPERDVSGGLAPAFGHGMLDFGYMINDNAHLGLYFRWQFAPPQNFAQVPLESKEPGSFVDSEEECMGLGLPGDCLLGLKYRWFFKDIDRFRMYSSTGAGFGRVRHWLRLEEPYFNSNDEVTDRCSGKDRVQEASGEICYIRDTVRPGWAHFGVGAGVMWPVHTNVDVGVDGYLMVLVPETAINLDLNVAANFRF